MLKSKIRTILGSGDVGTRLSSESTREMITTFYSSGNVEVDTAWMYGGGKSEEYIGKCEISHNKDIKIATKANPWDGKTLSSKSIKSQLETSLERLQCSKVDVFYLHAPDHQTPVVESLEAVNELYQEGKFNEFGLSNYASWKVAEIYTICKTKNWILPTVYQGMYNFITRQVEKELFPCLEHYGIRFYAYNPLACGFLSGKHKFEDWTKTEPGRFFGDNKWQKLYRERYWRKKNFENLEKIKTTLDKVYGLGTVPMAEAAYRWLYHHSKLDSCKGDGVVIGASTAVYLNENLSYTNKPPLDELVVKEMEKCWGNLSATCPNYFR